MHEQLGGSPWCKILISIHRADIWHDTRLYRGKSPETRLHLCTEKNSQTWSVFVLRSDNTCHNKAKWWQRVHPKKGKIQFSTFHFPQTNNVTAAKEMTACNKGEWAEGDIGFFLALTDNKRLWQNSKRKKKYIYIYKFCWRFLVSEVLH